jgi:predicted Ser/Thr protein kinase
MSTPHILDAPEGTDIAGFAVEGLLGTGGYGVVYRATRGGAEVALKLQPLDVRGAWPEREVSLLVRLRHRNVVGFRGCGLFPEGAPRGFYLAMEYVRGRPLPQWVDEENPGARRAAELMRGLAGGLEATHAAGVLHRDIKESNVVVREADGEPVLVDFGVGAYAGAPRLTAGVLPPGTPRYRSPEALAFRRASRPGERYVASAADDLYALGVAFYWVLTGRHPFAEAQTPSEVEAVISLAPRAPRELNPRVPVELSALCLRLLEKRPEARGSATGLREALEAVLAGADASWEVPLCEAHSEGVTPDGHPEALEAWVPERATWEDSAGEAPPRRGKRTPRAMTRSQAVPVLEVRARMAPVPTTPASVLFRATTVLGVALGLVTAVLLVLGWRPPVWLAELGGAMVGNLRNARVAPADTKREDDFVKALPGEARASMAVQLREGTLSVGTLPCDARASMDAQPREGTLSVGTLPGEARASMDAQPREGPLPVGTLPGEARASMAVQPREGTPPDGEAALADAPREEVERVAPPGHPEHSADTPTLSRSILVPPAVQGETAWPAEAYAVPGL